MLNTETLRKSSYPIIPVYKPVKHVAFKRYFAALVMFCFVLLLFIIYKQGLLRQAQAIWSGANPVQQSIVSNKKAIAKVKPT